MQKYAIKAIEKAADLIGISQREVFDNIVTSMLSHTFTNPDGYSHLYLRPRFDAALTGEINIHGNVEAFGAALLAVLASLNAAAPFEDVITDFYGSLLVGEKGQFMTPGSLGLALSAFLGDPASAIRVAEPTCGTGSLVLGHMRRVFEKDGAVGLRSVELMLNDLDLRLLRIAVMQVMFHTIKNEAPVASIKAWRADLIKEYEATNTLVLECSSHRRVLSVLSGGSFRR
ncbi:N-6 DNA methylase [Agrobacterium salinitolerans]